jgi:tetratricopeptide (TPR) repeat protein
MIEDTAGQMAELLLHGVQALMESAPEWAIEFVDFVPNFLRRDPPELRQIFESTSQAIADDPNNVTAHFQCGVVCQSKGWYRQALADFVQVIRHQPKHSRAWLLSSEVLDRLGDQNGAQAARRIALDLDPTLNESTSNAEPPCP